MGGSPLASPEGLRGSDLEYQAIGHLSARLCATIQISFSIEDHSTGERAIDAAS